MNIFKTFINGDTCHPLVHVTNIILAIILVIHMLSVEPSRHSILFSLFLGSVIYANLDKLIIKTCSPSPLSKP